MNFLPGAFAGSTPVPGAGLKACHDSRLPIPAVTKSHNEFKAVAFRPFCWCERTDCGLRRAESRVLNLVSWNQRSI
jgi:hypothetical protein